MIDKLMLVMAVFCDIQKFKDLYMVGHGHSGAVAVSVIR